MIKEYCCLNSVDFILLPNELTNGNNFRFSPDLHNLLEKKEIVGEVLVCPDPLMIRVMQDDGSYILQDDEGSLILKPANGQIWDIWSSVVRDESSGTFCVINSKCQSMSYFNRNGKYCIQCFIYLISLLLISCTHNLFANKRMCCWGSG